MNKYFFILFLIVLLIFWNWLNFGVRVANDYPYVSTELLKSFLSVPWVWNDIHSEGLGSYTIITLWSYPLNLLLGIIANLGGSFVVLERLIVLVCLLSGGFSIWKLGEYLKLSFSARIVSAVFYLINSYILLVIDGGQLNIALVYGIFPFVYLVIKRASESAELKNILIAGVCLSVVGFLDIRFVFMVGFLSIIDFVFSIFSDIREWKTVLFKWVKLGLGMALIFLGLHAYWVFPILITPVSGEEVQRLTATSFESSVNIGHALTLLSPHWFKNIFGEISGLRVEFIMIPVLVFAAAIFQRKKIVGFWLMVALIGVFLAKGFADPMGEIYKWLFLNIPVFSLFRDSTKFFFLICLAYAVLIGFSVDGLSSRFKSWRRIIVIGTVSYFILIVYPIWTNQMTGTFSNPRFESEFKKIESTIKRESDFFRVFWIPSTKPLTYSDPNHTIVEALRVVGLRPFRIGIKGGYEIFNFLRESSFAGELLDITGVKYIIYPPLDPLRDNLNRDNIQYYATFSNQISEAPWVKTSYINNLPIFETKSHQKEIFLAENIWAVVGSDNIYLESTKSSKLRLASNALVFIEEVRDPSLIDKLNGNIVFYRKGEIDLAASYIPKENIFFPAVQLRENSHGWWRGAGNILVWRDFLNNKYGLDNLDFDLGGGWAVSEGSNKLKVDIGSKKGELLLARVFESSKSGELRFLQDDNLIAKVNTKKDGDNFRWIVVGKTRDSRSMTIESDGDINIVNAIAIIGESEWGSYLEKVTVLEDRIKSYSSENIVDYSVKISYEKINPTKYKVLVSGLMNPGMVILSQKYHPSWKMDGQDSIKVYSLLNGFVVNQDGEYTIEFEGQKNVYPGLIVSAVTLVFVTCMIFGYRLRRKKHENWF